MRSVSYYFFFIILCNVDHKLICLTKNNCCVFPLLSGRKYVSILMRFWYLTSAGIPDDSTEGARIFQVTIGGEGEKPETKRLLTANYE